MTHIKYAAASSSIVTDRGGKDPAPPTETSILKEITVKKTIATLGLVMASLFAGAACAQSKGEAEPIIACSL